MKYQKQLIFFWQQEIFLEDLRKGYQIHGGKSAPRKIFEFSFGLKHPKKITPEGRWGWDCKYCCPQVNVPFYFPKNSKNYPFAFRKCPFLSWDCPFVVQKFLFISHNNYWFQELLLLFLDCLFYLTCTSFSKNPFFQLIVPSYRPTHLEM